jgi:2-iminobutanoate/2-iminopropanoate deaminase
MEKVIILSQNAPAPMPVYSQGVKAGGFLFLAGQIPMNPSTGELVKSTIAEETQCVLSNLGAVLQAAGANYNSVVRVSAYLTDIADFAAFNAAYAAFFPKDPPARTTVQVAALPRGARVEMDLIAYIP